MEPSILIPTPDPIPVPWGWFKFFLLSTFMAHILLMNVMVGTGIIVFFSHLRKDSQKHLEPLERDISKKLTFIIAFAVNFGVAPLLFLQVLYGHFVYVSSMLMGVYWLSIFVLLIIAYYSAYYYKLRFDALRTARIYLIGMAVLILLVIGFFFTNNMTLMLTPETWTRYFENPEGTLLNLSDSTLFPRFLHFMTASVAIGGLFIAITWSLKEKKRNPRKPGECGSENEMVHHCHSGSDRHRGVVSVQPALGHPLALHRREPVPHQPLNDQRGTGGNHPYSWCLSQCLARDRQHPRSGADHDHHAGQRPNRLSEALF
ncbi:MAG: hypothetical protein B6245_15415 [Desulfobacteraceae bacterium 4572_88]|nr:MAG: hypothetical protein B6245_15415 [Desulfobacteraceae bacterium 4572_88]